MKSKPTVTVKGKAGLRVINTEDLEMYEKKGYKVVEEAKPEPTPEPAKEEEEGDGLTPGKVKKMTLKELAEVVTDFKLDISLEEMSVKDARKAVINALKG